MHKILLVEDSADCQFLVTEILKPIATIEIARTVREAREHLKSGEFELLILDMQLPDGDGMELFAELQRGARGKGLPVIFLTGKSEPAVQATAFRLGAEDFVPKPLRPVEFRARVEARLRKQALLKAADATVLSRGPLRIELAVQKVFLEPPGEARTEVELTAREFKLLCQLVRHEGTVFSREELITRIWGAGVHVLDRTIDTHIYALRKKLGPYSSCIESEIGKGYRFNEKAKQAA